MANFKVGDRVFYAKSGKWGTVTKVGQFGGPVGVREDGNQYSNNYCTCTTCLRSLVYIPPDATSDQIQALISILQ